MNKPLLVALAAVLAAAAPALAQKRPLTVDDV